MNKQAILPAIFVFLLPFINDFIVFGASGQMDKLFNAPTSLLGNATFAVLPFLLIGSAMKPRPRVTRALWIVAVLTVVLWGVYAFTGLSLQSDDSLMATNFFIYMGIMVWPFVSVILMGIIAKYGEWPIEEV